MSTGILNISQRAHISEALNKEINKALYNGGFILFGLGVGCGSVLGILLVLEIVKHLWIPFVFAYLSGFLSLAISLLAKREMMKGWLMYLVFLVYVNMPTFFFLTSHFILPSGAATYIPGPMTYLYSILIIISGFTFHVRLPIIAGVIASIAYYSIFILSKPFLLQIAVSDPILFQELTDNNIYMLKSAMFLTTGLLVSSFTLIAKKLVIKARLEEREKAMVNKLFGQYVSDEVKEKIIESQASTNGEQKDVAILFSDIRGFTSFSEFLSPQEVVQHLNEYFDKMVDSISASHGVVDKFIGDAIMGVFGGVLKLEKPCDAALEAAMGMQRGLEELNIEWEQKGLSVFQIGIGLHFGSVLQGPIGSQNRKDFTIIGDSVNTTARIESLTKDYQTFLLISESFYHRLSKPYQAKLKYIDQVQIRGKEQEVKLYTPV